MADPLQCRQHLGEHGAALHQGAAKARLVRIERLQPRFGGGDLCFQRAHALRRCDQVLIELAPVGGDRLDLTGEGGLRFRRFALFGADRVEVAVALFQRIDP